ncbi:molybdenum cofactor synthesis domain-containing protein/competence/damage-inducible protein CinA N-terminal domain-containing protein [Methylomagnum ishizawai]|uniref:CinA-like protein n=1 Tax=Methylomagnum ishizawai TaxID=1760988 RepID=A0A1Y6CU67_9GAMM|nr:molybdopterin-binding protein [Methylomagnum ishizawai]SMF94168.1 molybdenum cofactor synthesis domain-containing protein/competence/damage-inducible protein CinA N-terminal domain-containing protein [Methylomagnum ishizawai]
MTPPLAEIFSQGDEVVTGEIADTNAAWLARELVPMGFHIARHSAVGDRLDALVSLLREISARADLCLCSGGLGPTCDDLTAEAVAHAFDLPLVEDPEALRQIEAWFARSGRPMPAVNRKQALLPQGAERLDNLWGTAPGFAVQAGRCRFVFMPGVPTEMKAMFGHWVKPDLARRYVLAPEKLVILRTVGVGESALQELLEPVELPPGVRLGFRAGGPENQVKLLFPAACPEEQREATVRRAMAAIGEAVYAIGGDEEPGSGLEAVAGKNLDARRAKLFIVEAASGGLLASRCAGREWLLGTLAASPPETLHRWLGGKPEGDGPRVAATLAVMALARSGADFALVQLAEPDALKEGSGPAPVHFALAGSNRLWQESRVVSGNPQRKRLGAAALALDFLRRRLPGG